ncbi:hypothetical protein BRC96_04200 [Halobacteriales archaeon QS_6_64_34]|nr:MAG: hypothetical protein BRC96_04200 [Halobacteriales archaeon QS_6_64_34]
MDSDQSYREDSRLWRTLTVLVGSIPSLLEGESLDLELDSGEIHLTILDESDVVEVSQEIHGLPESVNVYEPYRIELAAFVKETYRAVSEWHETAGVNDSERPVADWYQDLTDAIDTAEAAMTGAGIKLPS